MDGMGEISRRFIKSLPSNIIIDFRVCVLYYMSSIHSTPEGRESGFGSFNNPPKSPSSERPETIHVNSTSAIVNEPELVESASLCISDENCSTSNGVDEYEVHFCGSGDKEDPRNFGRARKWLFVIIISLTSASV